jgi:hypothetical protein
LRVFKHWYLAKARFSRVFGIQGVIAVPGEAAGFVFWILNWPEVTEKLLETIGQLLETIGQFVYHWYLITRCLKFWLCIFSFLVPHPWSKDSL